MKQFISFIRKEFFHIFRDRRTMLILLGMPIVQIILFGFAITTEVKNVRVAVYQRWYIERRYFLFVTYLIISRYRKTQT